MREISERVGVSITTWKNHRASGCPVPTARTKRSLDKWEREYRAWRTANDKVPPQDRKVLVDPNKAKWDVEQKKWAAMERKIRVGLLARRLVDRGEVEDRTVRQIMVVRQALSDMVRKLSPRFFKAPSLDVLMQEFQDEIDHICQSFADGLQWASEPEVEVAAMDDQ